jgi:hypothetical protein
MVAEQLQLVKRGIPFAAMKIDGVASQLPEVWDFLMKNNLQYDPSSGRNGVIPISWIFDREYGIQKGDIMVVGKSEEDIMRTRDTVLLALEKAGLTNTHLKLSSQYSDLPEYQA